MTKIIKYIVIFIMTILGAFGGFFLKQASGNADSIIRLILNKNLFIGAILYGTAAVLNIIILRYLPYTVVLPLTSITYIWTLLIARIFLNEKVTKNKIMGIALILGGVILISYK